MTHLERVTSFLATQPANIKRDQFFLIDPAVMKQLVSAAQVTKNDRVLEVGTGLGFLTEILALRVKSVMTIEIDPRFKAVNHLPANVEVIDGDAYKLLNQPSFHATHRSPTKTISSIPYSQAQNMLHNYTNWPWYQGDVVWLAPLTLAEKVNTEPILGAYFKAEVMQVVPPTAFYPLPNTTSAIIVFHRIEDPKQTKDFEIYFRRWLYSHENMKVKKAIMECIIHAAHDLTNTFISKKQAKAVVASLQLPEEELEKLTSNIRPEYYFELAPKILPQIGFPLAN